MPEKHHTFIALLRGINVSGHRIIRMKELKKSIESLGYLSVQTYIQSGNIIFKHPTKTPDVISKEIKTLLKLIILLMFPLLLKRYEDFETISKITLF